MKYVSSITTALLLTFAVCFAFACPANAQAAEKAAAPILSVDGSGTASGAPDQAIVSIGVTNYAANAGDAQTENASRAAAIQTALLQLGIPAGTLCTASGCKLPSRNMESTST